MNTIIDFALEKIAKVKKAPSTRRPFVRMPIVTGPAKPKSVRPMNKTDSGVVTAPATSTMPAPSPTGQPVGATNKPWYKDTNTWMTGALMIPSVKEMISPTVVNQGPGIQVGGAEGGFRAG